MLWADDDETFEIIAPKKKAYLLEKQDISICCEQMQILDNNRKKKYIYYV
mgnify:CR=1 FL=1